MRDTAYAKELASAEYDGARVERILIKSTGEEEIRFSWWKDGKMAPRPLDLSEDDLLELIRRGLDQEVFTDRFQLELLRAVIAGRGAVSAAGA